MKLELKHYVGYLPYGLIGDLGGQKIILNVYTGSNGDLMVWDISLFLRSQVKPILRHFNSLTDEELEEIKAIFGLDDRCFGIVCTPRHHWFAHLGDILEFNMDVLQYLYSKHIDVFNLIENGLAIKKED